MEKGHVAWEQGPVKNQTLSLVGHWLRFRPRWYICALSNDCIKASVLGFSAAVPYWSQHAQECHQ